jgi:hypothetical protein
VCLFVTACIAALCDFAHSSARRALVLHYSSGRGDYTRTFKIQKRAVLSTPSLPLTDHDGMTNLLTQFGLSLLDGGQDHVTHASGRKPVETALDPAHGDDIKVFGTRVVSAVHNRADRQAERHAKLAA